jgi:hypothetical protein
VGPELEKYLSFVGYRSNFLKWRKFLVLKLARLLRTIYDAIDFLANVVKKNKLHKVLIVHPLQGMVTNYKKIKTVPEVQVVMDMDGFGSKVLKRSTYIFREPVQFTGFKLLQNDNWKLDHVQNYC